MAEKFLDLAIKTTNTVIMAIVTNYFALIVYSARWPNYILSIDALFNSLSIYLSYSFTSKYYDLIFSPCHNKCYSCCSYLCFCCCVPTKLPSDIKLELKPKKNSKNNNSKELQKLPPLNPHRALSLSVTSKSVISSNTNNAVSDEKDPEKSPDDFTLNMSDVEIIALEQEKTDTFEMVTLQQEQYHDIEEGKDDDQVNDIMNIDTEVP